MTSLTTAVREWWRSVTDLRRDELRPAGLLFAYGFLALASHWVVKPVRNSVFVDRVGAQHLPVVYVLTAVLVALLAAAYSRYAARTDERRLLLATFGAVGGGLLLFWRLLGEAGVVVSGAFFVFGKIYPVFLISQFWLVGNLLFTARQAKRLFGPVGLGLVLGGAAGSWLSGAAAGAVESRDLLLVAAAILAVCAAIVWRLVPDPEEREEADPRLSEELDVGALRLLRNSPHLRTVALILGLTVVVSTLVDWQFNRAVQLHIPGEDAKTAFYGNCFALINLASVVVQAFFTAFVIRRLGIGVALLVLPVGILVAAAGVVAVPALMVASAAKATDGSLRYSVDQSTRELLYLPVPSAVKARVKPLIDVAVHRGGSGLAGLVLLVATNWLGGSIREVALLAALLCVAWIAAALRMKEEYAASVRRLIGVRDVDLGDLIVEQLDAETVEQVRRTLRRGTEDEILYALSLLEQAPAPGLEEELGALLRHESEAVRARAVSLLYDMGRPERVDEVEELLEDSSLEVRARAIRFVCDFGGVDPGERMEAFLREEDDEVRCAAMACLLREGGPEERGLALVHVLRLARDEDAGRRRWAAELLGELDRAPAEAREELDGLIEDPAVEVRREALRAAGRSEARELAPALVGGLGDPDVADAAREGLEKLSPEVHPALARRLSDPETAAPVQERLAGALYARASQRTVEELWRALASVERAGVRYRILKTLDKLRRDRSDLDFGRLDVAREADRELDRAYRWTAVAHALGAGGGRRRGERGPGSGEGSRPEKGIRPASLLERTVRQRRREAVERALRVLGLRHSLERLYAAYTALTSRERVDRERGLELLESVLPLRYRNRLSPLLDPGRSFEDGLPPAARVPDGREAALEGLARHDDFWVALLARRARGEPLFRPERGDPDPARWLRAAAPVEAELRVPRSHESHEESLMEILERAEFLAEVELFSGLRTEDLAGLATLMRERECREGEVIFEEGELSAELYVVVEGAVEARREEGGVAFTARDADAFGSLSLLDGLPRHYTTIAVQDTRLLVLEQDDFFHLLEERFALTREVVSYLAGEVRRAEVPGSGRPGRREAPEPGS